MAEGKSMKRNYIAISSSEESDLESHSPDSDEDSVLTISSSNSSDDDEVDNASTSKWNDWEDDEAEVDGDEGSCVDVESMSNKVIQIIRGKSDLHGLKLIECKAYLRRHGLRLSGAKGECIERIKEHWRLKNGNGETLYPRSSFVMNCTGDVCKGDVVLFNQKVYQILNNSTNNKSLCRRTVAGRIVKESYGSAKQQHTFTVEVLWSKGAKRLYPLSPLLVKGRNLYKMKTYRQRWKNEKERLEVLDEKHKRGAAARTLRAIRKTKVTTKTQKSSVHKDTKRRKHNSHQLGSSSRTRETIQEKNRLNENGKALAKNKKRDPRLSSNPSQPSNRKQNSYMGRQNVIQSDHRVLEPQNLSYDIPSRRYYHFQPDVFPREPHHFLSTANFHRVREPQNMPYDIPSRRFDHFQPDTFPREPHHFPSTANLSYSGPFPNSIDPGYSHSRSSHVSRNLDCFPRLTDEHPSLYPSTSDTYRWR